MQKLLSLSIATAFIATNVFASPAVVTAGVNLRSGPGTGFPVIGGVSKGSEVELKQCDAGGNWCAVQFGDRNGFISGRYLSQPQTPVQPWPRTFTTEAGAILRLFAPQVVSWSGLTKLDALIAAELKTSATASPVYGVIGVSAKTVAEDQTGNVVLTDLRTTSVNFSTLDKEELSKLALAVGTIMPTDSITVSQQRLAASFASYEQLNDVADMKAEAPPVFTSEQPAILVQTEGDPVISPVQGVQGLSFVVNTNWDIFQTTSDKTFYLRNEKAWLKSDKLDSRWVTTDELPQQLSSLPDDEVWKDVKASLPASSSGKAPTVFYSSIPAELIAFDGRPSLKRVPGTSLEWASNTTSDVFFDTGAKTWYILLSGRWFSSASLDGPWVFATPNLPAAFQRIPSDASYYDVRASVPGTSESAEARLKASIPQMARIATDGSLKVDVAYSGDPVFEPIDGTNLSYAVNTNDQVIRVGDSYYVLKDGVWFVGKSATGPFEVARAVPDEIYAIPASSPVHNVTYVKVYETEPDAVWYGYTSGYLGAYLAWNTLVWGTGWTYRPWWDMGHPGYWPYFPRPVTFGIGAFYNPAIGTFGRYGYAYGPFRGIAGGAAYNPRTGTYIRGGTVYGLTGSRGFVTAYNPRSGNSVVARGGSNIYGSWGSAAVRHGDELTRIRGRSSDEAAGLRWRNSEGHRGFVAGGSGGDIYAGRDGNVYRRHDGEWQERTEDGWKAIKQPMGEGRERAREKVSSGREQLREREDLRIDRAARGIGDQRDFRRDFRDRRMENNRPRGGRELRDRTDRRGGERLPRRFRE